MEFTRYTFGVGTAYAGRYVEVIHPRDIDARQVMQRIHGMSWASEYIERFCDWNSTCAKHGWTMLLRVTVDEFGGEEYEVFPDA